MCSESATYIYPSLNADWGARHHPDASVSGPVISLKKNVTCSQDHHHHQHSNIHIINIQTYTTSTRTQSSTFGAKPACLSLIERRRTITNLSAYICCYEHNHHHHVPNTVPDYVPRTTMLDRLPVQGRWRQREILSHDIDASYRHVPNCTMIMANTRYATANSFCNSPYNPSRCTCVIIGWEMRWWWWQAYHVLQLEAMEAFYLAWW